MRKPPLNRRTNKTKIISLLLKYKINLKTMKKINLLLTAALAAAFLQACSGAKSNSTSDSTATKTDSSTTVVKTDSASTVLPDTAFAAKAAVGGMAEVALGKMAAAKSTDKQVKDFGNMMVTDHGKANAELMTIAKSKNITLPATLDAEHQAKSDSLSKLSGADFDKAYVAAMIEGHKKTLALMQSEAANGKDAELKAFAAKTAPVVQMHLDHIAKIHGSLK
jgi:putative membrane protein